MIDRSASALLQAVRNREISAQELTTQYLDRIAHLDERVNAFLHVNRDRALRQATVIDERRTKGEALGGLAGLPIAVKDVLCMKGEPTTCGSKILKNFKPPYDAHAIERLQAADVVVLGKTNLDEFAMGSSTENSGFKVTRNPWDLERIPGGSSGGSAAAVAAGMAPVALGTDTGGSVRQPAALCGVVGLKPTYGRVSRYGLIAYGSSLDQVGVFGREVGDVALILEHIAGHDGRDSTSVSRNVPSYSRSVEQAVKPLTIGVPREFFGEGLDTTVERSVREGLAIYEKNGAKVLDVSLPHTRYAIATYYLVATAEASSNLARYDGVHFGHRAEKFKDLIDMTSRSRDEGFGTEVKRRIMLGTYALSSGYKDAYYLKALKVRRLIKEDFDKAFAMCDVIMGPTTPTPAFKIGEKSTDPLAMYLSDIYTISANLAGIPGISVPCGFSGKLPIGLQILAPQFEEEKLLRIARMFERETEWHKRRPY